MPDSQSATRVAWSAIGPKAWLIASWAGDTPSACARMSQALRPRAATKTSPMRATRSRLVMGSIPPVVQPRGARLYELRVGGTCDLDSSTGAATGEETGESTHRLGVAHGRSGDERTCGWRHRSSVTAPIPARVLWQVRNMIATIATETQPEAA